MSSVPARSPNPVRLLSPAIIVFLLFCGYLAQQAWAAEEAQQTFSSEQLEQIAAPVALHPDSLLSQILMASTYPLEIVQAARWVKENPKVTGKALEDAMEKQPWDPSVKSLAAFPQVLQMMNDELDWTRQLGDAFLAQQEALLDAVQRLRAQADKAGNLKTTKEQKVEKQTVTVESGQKETIIVVEQADPEVIYVPAYDPTVIYGVWRYPAYPPYYWYPPGYVARRALWFAAGVAVGRALWGGCDWRHRSVNINVNRYNSFNRTTITNPKWNHNPRHRHGVPYKNRDVAKIYGKGTRDVRAREQFRGRAEAGRRDLPRPGAGQLPGAGQRPGTGQRPAAGQRPSTPQRPTAGQRPAAPKTPKVAARPATPKARPAPRPKAAKRPSAYQGIGKGKQVRKQSLRGKSSRQASRSRSASRPSKSRGGGGGRGGSRGGGGRRR